MRIIKKNRNDISLLNSIEIFNTMKIYFLRSVILKSLIKRNNFVIRTNL